MMPKVKKINKKKTSNVIPIKKDVIEVENNDQLSIEDQERERTNKFARKICDEIDEFVKECKMNSDMTYYHFLFHLKQRTILNVSYGLYKSANDASSNEVVKNLAEYLKSKGHKVCFDLYSDVQLCKCSFHL